MQFWKVGGEVRDVGESDGGLVWPGARNGVGSDDGMFEGETVGMLLGIFEGCLLGI